MRRSLVWLTAALPVSLGAQQPQMPWRSADHVAAIPRAELDAITARGRLLAEYDLAAWHGTDAVMALRPRSDVVQGYLARPRTDGRWEVLFGRGSANADTFLVAYRAVQSERRDTVYVAAELVPALRDTDSLARAYRALDISRREFRGTGRPYNAMVIPAGEGGEWYVYIVPAPTQAGVWPLGGDMRYRVSADGRSILERRRLHNSILEFGPRPNDGNQLEAGWHSGVLSDRPEDTDVFHVLTRRPRVPEYIVTKSYYFRIDVDGRIAAFDRDTTIRH